jgi:hypothetical protein
MDDFLRLITLLPRDELRHFLRLPRTGIYKRAFEDACVFLEGVIDRALDLWNVEISETRETIQFSWRRTTVYIPFQQMDSNKDMRFFVYYANPPRREWINLKFTTVEEALIATANFVKPDLP